MNVYEHATSRATLFWRRANPFREWFDLLAEDQLLASLVISGGAITTAQLDSDHYQLLFTEEGVASQRIRILEANRGGGTVATFDRRRSGHAGTLTLVEGGQLDWRRVGWWRPCYAFTDRFGNAVVRLRPDGSVVDDRLAAQLDLSVDLWRDLVLLLALGWFLLVTSGSATPPGPARCGRQT